jgi:hypothetical protein
MRILIIALTLFLSLPAAAQDRVDPGALGGVWRLEFDIDPASGESAVERIALKLATGFLDEMEIRFSFLEENRLRVMVDAFDTKKEDWSTWRITPEGYLAMGDSDHFDAEDTLWYADGDRLVAFSSDDEEEDGRLKSLALVRILD